MADRLQNILTGSVAVGGSASPLHGIQIAGRSVLPDLVLVVCAEAVTVTCNATNITVTNTDNVVANYSLYVIRWYSIDRAFGSSLNLDLSPQPFIVYTGRSAEGVGCVSIDDFGGAADYDGANGTTATDNAPAFNAAYAAAAALGLPLCIPGGRRLFLLPAGTQLDVTSNIPIYGDGSFLWGPGSSRCTLADNRATPDTQTGEIIGFRTRNGAETVLSNLWLDGPAAYINNTLRAVWGENVGKIRLSNVRIRNFRQGIWVDEDPAHNGICPVEVRDRCDVSAYEVGLLHRSWTGGTPPVDRIEDSTWSVRDPLGLFVVGQGHCLYLTNGVNLVSRKNTFLDSNGYGIQHFAPVGGTNATQVVSEDDVFGGGPTGLTHGAILGPSVCEMQVYNPTLRRTGEWGFRVRTGGMRIIGGKVTGAGADSACVLNLTGENGPLTVVGMSLDVGDPGWCVGVPAGEPSASWRFIGCNFRSTRANGQAVELLASMVATFEDCTFEDSAGTLYHIAATGGVIRTSRCSFAGAKNNRANPTVANLTWHTNDDRYLGTGRLECAASAPRTTIIKGRGVEYPAASGPLVTDATASGQQRLIGGYATYTIPANNDVTIDTLADALLLEGPNDLENLWIAGGPGNTDPLRLYQGQVVTCIIKTAGFAILGTGNIVAAAGARVVNATFQLLLDGTTWRELP